VLKRVKSECRKLTGFSRCPIRLFPDCAAGKAGASRRWCLAASWVGGRGGVGWSQGLSAGAAWCGGLAEVGRARPRACWSCGGWKRIEQGRGQLACGRAKEARWGGGLRAGASCGRAWAAMQGSELGRKSGPVAWRTLGVGRPSLLGRGRAGCARGRLSEGERGRMDGVDWQEMGWAGFSRSWGGFSRCTGFSRSEVRL
jgi:hypothetical protein